MRLDVRRPTLAAILTAFAVAVAGSSCGGSETADDGADRTATLGSTRASVIQGARRDFQDALEGPRGFEECFISRFRRRLSREALVQLRAIHAKEGEPAAARALNGLGVADGDACGGRRWVPKLIEAATGLT